MTVTCTVEGAVAEVRMDRPDKLNSLGEAMVADFHAALDQVGDARAVLCSPPSAGPSRPGATSATPSR